jgi:hypothetical protein
MAFCVSVTDSGMLQQVAGDPAECSHVIFSGAEYASFQSVLIPVDYSQSAGAFSFFFFGTLALWFFAKNIGLLLSAIRRF